MIFTLLNANQNSIAASCVLVLGVAQICVDSWTLFKLEEHEQLLFFLFGNTIGRSNHNITEMTYNEASSYFGKLKDNLNDGFLEILSTLQMTAIVGIVAGIFQLFSSTGALMWNGMSVDIFWLVMNFIAGIFLTVAVSHISIYMIRDVPYHQVLLTVTSVNLFILAHIWTVNLIALIYVKFFGGQQSKTPSIENAQPDSHLQTASTNSGYNTHANNNPAIPASATTTVVTTMGVR